MTLFINYIGGPSSGKSTAALRTALMFKESGKSSELVTEVAKDLVWENRMETLKFQPYITSKQHRNLCRLDGKVDYVITDAPLILGIVYGREYGGLPPSYDNLWTQIHRDMNSIVVRLEREFPYQSHGRLQKEEEAKRLDGLIDDVLDEFNIPHMRLKPTEVGEWVKETFLRE